MSTEQMAYDLGRSHGRAEGAALVLADVEPVVARVEALLEAIEILANDDADPAAAAAFDTLRERTVPRLRAALDRHAPVEVPA